MKLFTLLIALSICSTVGAQTDTVYLKNNDSARITATVINTNTGKEIGMFVMAPQMVANAVAYDAIMNPVVVTISDRIWISYLGSRTYYDGDKDALIRVSVSGNTICLHEFKNGMLKTTYYSNKLVFLSSVECPFPFKIVDIISVNGLKSFILSEDMDKGIISQIEYNSKQITHIAEFSLLGIYYPGKAKLTGIAYSSKGFYISTDRGLHHLLSGIDLGVQQLTHIKSQIGIAQIFTNIEFTTGTDLAFNNVSLKYINDKQVEVTFDIKHVDKDAIYEIQVSKGNPNDFKTVQIIFGTDLNNEIRKTIINL